MEPKTPSTPDKKKLSPTTIVVVVAAIALVIFFVPGFSLKKLAGGNAPAQVTTPAPEVVKPPAPQLIPPGPAPIEAPEKVIPAPVVVEVPATYDQVLLQYQSVMQEAESIKAQILALKNSNDTLAKMIELHNKMMSNYAEASKPKASK
jgi:hypothetical protein